MSIHQLAGRKNLDPKKDAAKLDRYSLVAHTPERCGVAVVLRLFVSLQVGRQISMQCTVLVGSMQYWNANIRVWWVVIVVRLFVGLQGGRAISVISVQKKKNGRFS
jgi:hypothetical protein